jgi:hypothetical protein
MGSVGLSVGEPTVQEQARLQVAREENARLRKRLEDKDREVFLLKVSRQSGQPTTPACPRTPSHACTLLCACSSGASHSHRSCHGAPGRRSCTRRSTPKSWLSPSSSSSSSKGWRGQRTQQASSEEGSQ